MYSSPVARYNPDNFKQEELFQRLYHAAFGNAIQDNYCSIFDSGVRYRKKIPKSISEIPP